jgi:hypothetical protein
MMEVELGPIRFVVEHRQVSADGGPTLMVFDSVRGRELLRFDCFVRGPHWHVDPGGRNVIQKLETGVDPIEWTLAELRRELSAYLSRAEFTEDLPLDPTARGAALNEVEKALRNPPPS